MRFIQLIGLLLLLVLSNTFCKSTEYVKRDVGSQHDEDLLHMGEPDTQGGLNATPNYRNGTKQRLWRKKSK